MSNLPWYLVLLKAFLHRIFILEAIRCKFKLSSQQLKIQWPNIDEAILTKGRNWKKNGPQSNTGDTIPSQDSNKL